MENGVKQRIREIIEVTDNSVNSFAKEIGVKQTTLSDYLNSGKTPSWAVLRGIVDTFTDVSVEWLIRGEGEMYISDIPTDGDTDTILDLKAEITRLRAERDELRDELIAQRAVSKYQEKQIRELMGIAPQRISVAADSRVSYATDNILK